MTFRLELVKISLYKSDWHHLEREVFKASFGTSTQGCVMKEVWNN